jgi:signal peptidase II
MGLAWGKALAVAAGVIALDQATKAVVRSGIDKGDENPVLPAIKLVHVENKGVAFGFLSDGGAILVVLVAFAALALIIWFALHADRPLAWLPTGLLLGGAIGNVIDRLALGGVTDFVKLPAWPAFNVADMAITFGVLILVLVLERRPDAPA